MSVLEDSIAVETEYIKEVYAKASKSMSESQHYFLNGVQISACWIELSQRDPFGAERISEWHNGRW